MFFRSPICETLVAFGMGFESGIFAAAMDFYTGTHYARIPNDCAFMLAIVCRFNNEAFASSIGYLTGYMAASASLPLIRQNTPTLR